MLVKSYIQNHKGLTLIELLAVVVIPGILSSIAILTFTTVIESTKKMPI